MAEPCALIVIFVTLGMILPLFFPCTPTQVGLAGCSLRLLVWARCRPGQKPAPPLLFSGAAVVPPRVVPTMVAAYSGRSFTGSRASAFRPVQCVIIQGETKPLCPEGTPQDIK